MIPGLLVRCSRNSFLVRVEEETGEERDLECHIKGKILKGVENCYNPLAPGDRVEVEADPGRPGTGRVISLLERRNFFSRLNQKGMGPGRAASSQILAANVDLVLLVTTPLAPPFRPRFLDRVLIQADLAGIPPAIICNKWDISPEDPDVEERLEDFRRIGVPVLRLSAHTGEGMDELRALIRGKFSGLLGQSGVGKSSLVNALIPNLHVQVGTLNEKYDRGNHTTTQALLLEIPGDGPRTWIIDTPGIRRFVPQGLDPAELILHMGEFAPLSGKCSFGLSCSHETEPGCKILEAVHAGVIHPDRYESYLRIREELAARRKGEESGCG